MKLNDRGFNLDWNIEGVQGVYWWLTHHYTGIGHYYQKLCAISKWYKPGLMERGPNSDESWRVYNELCQHNQCCIRTVESHQLHRMAGFNRNRA